MRDIALTLFVVGLLPFIFKRPWIGALLWAWLGFMSPHRLAYGFAYSLPFAQVVGIVTLISLVTTRERRHLPLSGPVMMIILLMLWMAVTSAFALHPEQGNEVFMKVLKIILMLLVSLSVLHTRRHIEALVAVVALSICFYGLKGGIFTLSTGGTSRVWGPPGSFIQGNNELALALVMTVPFVYYLYSVETVKWRKIALVLVALFSAVSVLGTQSRGGFLGISAMLAFLWVRSSKKVMMFILLGVVAAALLAFMPEKWFDRMHTIRTYEQDGSAMGRINAWHMAWNLATHRWIGGGFSINHPDVFMQYAPDPDRVLVAHSIYFQMLGEHGFVGLGLFLLMFLVTWRMANRVRRVAQAHDDVKWMSVLVAMAQVSLVGYFVGGAFLSLAYFDLPYYIVGVVVLCDQLLKERVKAAQSPDGKGGMDPETWRKGLLSPRVPGKPGAGLPLPPGQLPAGPASGPRGV